MIDSEITLRMTRVVEMKVHLCRSWNKTVVYDVMILVYRRGITLSNLMTYFPI